ncbi:MAG: CehA/McbA family metallohydrolase, partial [Arenicella sp.]|nr:CehA/McbA family metallohydrolase [Arenicella sp.]
MELGRALTIQNAGAKFIRRFAVLLLCLASGVAHAVVQGGQINTDNAAEWVQQGPDAIGGIGDWFISNGTLCAVISGIEHEGEFSAKGGVLIDLGYCDRADDHFTHVNDLLGDSSRPMDVDKIDVEIGESSATIVTLGRNSGVVVESRYTLTEQQPTQLSVSKRIRIADKDHADFNYYSPLWFNYHSLETYVYSTTDFARNKGFSNVDFVSRGSDAISEATHNADTLILPSPPEAAAPIAYGWQMRSAQRVSGNKRYDLPKFVLSDEQSSMVLVVADSFYIGDGSKLGFLQLLQIPLLSLDEGDAIELEEVFYVGDRADVASVTDQLLQGAPSVSGRVRDPASALHVELTDGTPVTFVRPDPDGRFSFRVPEGDYRIRHLGTAAREIEHPLTVEGKEVNLGLMALPKAAMLELPAGEAMRLVFVGINGTPNPDFDDRLTGYSVSDDEGQHFRDKVSQVFLAGIESDRRQVELAAGEYRVYATRGPEHSLSVTEVSVKPGSHSALEIAVPQRVLDTPGYIAADLHVHSGLSFDNTFSTSERVRTFVAEHGEVMVSSEHDRPTDFNPFLRAMGVTDKIISIPAAEMTSIVATRSHPHTGGHLNFFPFKPQPLAFRNGMFKHEDRRLRDILHEVRETQPGIIAQLNHARWNTLLSGEIPDNYQELIANGQFLDHMGVAKYPYNPSAPIDSIPNNSLIEPDPETGVRDIDVDAMELMNGAGKYYAKRIEALRKDWLSFLLQGLHITGTANSDSHHANEQVAIPRNMVAVAGDSVATFDQGEFLQALRSGNIYGTTGPMIEVSLSGATMGQTFRGSKGVLKVRVRHADWVPVETLSVQFNGREIARRVIGDQSEFEIAVEATEDGFVTVVVEGPASEDYSAVYADIT